MIHVVIELAGTDGDGSAEWWQIANIAIQFGEGQQAVHIGGFAGFRSYAQSIEHAKDWAMLRIRHNAREEEIEHIHWHVEPGYAAA
jgi:hypothetical protein